MYCLHDGSVVIHVDQVVPEGAGDVIPAAFLDHASSWISGQVACKGVMPAHKFQQHLIMVEGSGEVLQDGIRGGSCEQFKAFSSFCKESSHLLFGNAQGAGDFTALCTERKRCGRT